jgi:hypothetical protein
VRLNSKKNTKKRNKGSENPRYQVEEIMQGEANSYDEYARYPGKDTNKP